MTDRYATPLDQTRLAKEQGAERARICDRLETMWQGLQQDVEFARDNSERGVDPRLQQLQLQILKLQATLWRMTAAPLAEPEPEADPELLAFDARAAAEGILASVAAKLSEPEAGEESVAGPKPPPDTSWLQMTAG